MKNIKPVALLSLLLFAFIVLCDRSNPFDAKSVDYISGKKPQVFFVDDTLSAYLLDTVVIRIACADTTTGGKKGSIRKFYFSWLGNAVFTDSIDGTDLDTFVLKKTFPPETTTVLMRAIDNEGIVSDMDSIKLMIRTSQPAITAVSAPDSVVQGAPFPITITANDIGGIVQLYLFALHGALFIDSTTVETFTVSYTDTGKKTILLKVKDSKGVYSPVDTIEVVVFPTPDVTPPFIAITQPQPFSHIADSTVTLTGAATDASGIYSIYVNGTSAVRNNSVFSLKVTLKHGWDTLRVIATDSSTHRNTAIDSVILMQNIPPLFSAVQGALDTGLSIGETCVIPLSATDADGDTLKFTLLTAAASSASAPFLSDSAIRSVMFHFTPATAGMYPFAVEARDPWGGADTARWQVVVSTPGDSVPYFTTNKTMIPDSATALGLYSATVKAQDPRNKPLVYSLVKPPSPPSMTLDSTGKITWSPSEGDTGEFHIVVMASNGNQRDTLGWDLTIVPYNDHPVLVNPGDKTVDKLKSLTFTLVATDKNNDSLDYSFGTMFPLGAHLDNNVFSWTPAYFDAGRHQVIFIVKERSKTVPLADTQSMVITVKEVNIAPTLARPGTKNVSVNQNLSFTVLASDMDVNQILTYSMTNAPAGAVLTGNQFSWTPVYSQIGQYPVKFTVSDNGTPSLSDSATTVIIANKVNIAPVLVNPGNKSINENQLLVVTLSASDINGDSLTYSMANLPSGALLTGNQFSWTPSFSQGGLYIVKFYVKDNGTAPLSDSQTVTITVIAAIPTMPVLSGVVAGNASVTVSFAAVAGATSYNLYYQTGSAVIKGSATRITDVTSPWTVASLTNGTQYAFALSAVNVSGESTLSATLTATPGQAAPSAPVIDSITIAGKNATIYWRPVAGATSYTIYYEEGNSINKEEATSVPGATSPKVIKDLSKGTTAFAITATNVAGESPLSAVKTVNVK